MGGEIKANVDSASKTPPGRAVGVGIKQGESSGFGVMMDSLASTGGQDLPSSSPGYGQNVDAVTGTSEKKQCSIEIQGDAEGASALAAVLLQLQSVQSPSATSPADEARVGLLPPGDNRLKGCGAREFAKDAKAPDSPVQNQPLPFVDGMNPGAVHASGDTAVNLLPVDRKPLASDGLPFEAAPHSIKDDDPAGHGGVKPTFENSLIADAALAEANAPPMMATEFVATLESAGSVKKRSSDEKSGTDSASLMVAGHQETVANRVDVDPVNATTGTGSVDGDFSHQVSYWILNDVKNAEITVGGRDSEPVQVSISMTGSEAKLEFRTGDASTRDLIQTSLSQLEQMLKKEGVSLSAVSISQDRDMSQSGGRQSSAQDQPSPSGRSTKAVLVGQTSHRPLHATPGRLDLYV